MAKKKIHHQVTESDAGRIDALVAKLAELSRAQVRGLIDHGGVTLNGEACADAGARTQAGDRVQVTYEHGRRYKEKPAERATRGFTLVFADDHLAVVEKQVGVLTVPTARGETNTLVDLLSAHLSKGQSRRRKVAVVHRLDRETSGLLVFGRTPAIAKELIAQFAAHKPERLYAAIVAGEIDKDQGTIRSYLATDKALNQRSVSGREQGRGELAITHYQVEARYGDATLLAVRLETGRRNQIRVHVAELGHPILGDQRYAAERARHRRWPHDHLALHARRLCFKHPVTKKAMTFDSPLPREFTQFAAGAGRRDE